MKNILIVIDMQAGFARYPNTKDLSCRIESLLKRKVFDAVVSTRFLNDDGSIYEKLFGWNKLKSKEEQALSGTIQSESDYIVDKCIYNCVNPNFIQRLCQLNNGQYPEHVFLVGADTDCCVLTIATALFENNIRPLILTKYCDSNGGPKQHEAGLLCLRRLIGEKQLLDVDPTCKEDLSL